MVSVLGDSQLRSVTVQALGVLCLLVIAQIVNFFLTIDISVSGSSKPAELNNAGRRRYLAREAFNTARELLINDGEVGTLEELSGRLAATARFYEAVHDGLRHGSEELGLPGDQLRMIADFRTEDAYRVAEIDGRRSAPHAADSAICTAL